MTLPMFEDEEFDRSEMRITKAGDGLSEALRLMPIALHRHTRHFYVLEVEIAGVTFKTARDGASVRVHTAETKRIVQCDEALAKEAMEQQYEILERARAEAAGQTRIDDQGEEAS